MLCPECKEEVPPPPMPIAYHAGKTPEVFYKANGCPACHNTGYSEMRYLAEAIVFDETVAELLGRSAPVSELMAYLVGKKGFRGIASEAAEMLYAGNITAEEFISITKEDGGLIWPG